MRSIAKNTALFAGNQQRFGSSDRSFGLIFYSLTYCSSDLYECVRIMSDTWKDERVGEKGLDVSTQSELLHTTNRGYGLAVHHNLYLVSLLKSLCT